MGLFIALKRENKLELNGEHCIVTGGSKGLGRSLALLLYQRGAKLTLVARNLKDLTAAKQFILTYSESSISEKIQEISDADNDRVQIISADVTNEQACSEVIQESMRLHNGQSARYLFCCAGAAKPGMFTSQPLSEFRQSFDLNVMGSINIIQPFVNHHIKNETADGVKVVMTSSVLGLMGLAGYAQYVPAKFALRGFAECLRQEMLPYKVGVHIMFPATIYTPGFEEEQKRKPELTKILEGADEGQSPEVIAIKMLKGVERGQFMISSDPIGEMLRCSAGGAGPGNYGIGDGVIGCVGAGVFSLWRRFVDYTILKYHREHQAQDVPADINHKDKKN